MKMYENRSGKFLTNYQYKLCNNKTDINTTSYDLIYSDALNYYVLNANMNDSSIENQIQLNNYTYAIKYSISLKDKNNKKVIETIPHLDEITIYLQDSKNRLAVKKALNLIKVLNNKHNLKYDAIKDIITLNNINKTDFIPLIDTSTLKNLVLNNMHKRLKKK